MFQYAIRGFASEVDIDSPRNGFTVALDRLDPGKVRNPVDQRHPCCEVPRTLLIAADATRELQPRDRFCSLSHDPVPIRNGYSLQKYLPFYFDVKYFDIKLIN
jgi:hypothetical protein